MVKYTFTYLTPEIRILQIYYILFLGIFGKEQEPLSSLQKKAFKLMKNAPKS